MLPDVFSPPATTIATLSRKSAIRWTWTGLMDESKKDRLKQRTRGKYSIENEVVRCLCFLQEGIAFHDYAFDVIVTGALLNSALVFDYHQCFHFCYCRHLELDARINTCYKNKNMNERYLIRAAEWWQRANNKMFVYSEILFKLCLQQND